MNIELRTQLDDVYKLNKVSFKSNGITSTDCLGYDQWCLEFGN